MSGRDYADDSRRERFSPLDLDRTLAHLGDSAALLSYQATNRNQRHQSAPALPRGFVRRWAVATAYAGVRRLTPRLVRG